jgi:hypothetical protein
MRWTYLTVYYQVACETNKCICYKNGLECHEDSCGCTDEMCKNPKRHVFDQDKVDNFRKLKLLTENNSPKRTVLRRRSLPSSVRDESDEE